MDDYRRSQKLKTAAAVLILSAAVSGCLRLQAGTWYQGPGDEEPRVHEVDLNTQRLIQGNPPPGNITIDQE